VQGGTEVVVHGPVAIGFGTRDGDGQTTCRREESLASLARRALCRRCGQRTPLNCKLGMTTDCREKDIAFEGDIARKLGMG
jgi:hypothetical protein